MSQTWMAAPPLDKGTALSFLLLGYLLSALNLALVFTLWRHTSPCGDTSCWSQSWVWAGGCSRGVAESGAHSSCCLPVLTAFRQDAPGACCGSEAEECYAARGRSPVAVANQRGWSMHPPPAFTVPATSCSQQLGENPCAGS